MVQLQCFNFGIFLPASFVTNFASGRCSWSKVSCLPPLNMSVSKHPPGIPTSAYCVCAPCICCSNHAEGKRVLGTFTWTRWTSHPQGTNPTVWLLRHQQGRVHQRIPSWQTNDLFVLSLLPVNSSGWQGNPFVFHLLYIFHTLSHADTFPVPT